VVEIYFDPGQVSYEQLLNVFWDAHDPTSSNRQGSDVGSQYRSAIFFHSPEQEATAHTSKERLQQSGRFTRPIVTKIVPATRFYRAEKYHQRHIARQGDAVPLG
jgi:peptide-methionine (S)-S-oxide reductase